MQEISVFDDRQVQKFYTPQTTFNDYLARPFHNIRSSKSCKIFISFAFFLKICKRLGQMHHRDQHESTLLLNLFLRNEKECKQINNGNN